MALQQSIEAMWEGGELDAGPIEEAIELLDRGELRVAEPGPTGWVVHEWVKKAEIDSGARAGVPSDVAAQLKALERENRELRQANEILRKASAYFAQAELDRPFKR